MTLKKLRDQIDKIDEEIQALLTARASIALEVGKEKQKDESPLFYRPEREAEVIEAVMKRNKGPLSNDHLTAIYKQIMAACLNLQKSLKIAFLGPLGSFSHAAVLKNFGRNVILAPNTSIKNIFNAMKQEEIDYGLVPIENSSEGIVNQTLDLLAETPLKICAEIIIPVHHYLLSRCDDIKQISQVYSHPQALGQCQEWLEKNLPNAAIRPVSSTSQACILASKEATTAAIAGELALEYHELNTLEKNIEDAANNSTRFYLLGNQTTKATEHDKTTMILWLPHQSGALASLLTLFAKHSVNLTMIESRPYTSKLWEYVFFLEMEGHVDDKNMKNLIDELTHEKLTFKILGSYPRAI